ncbi:PXA domain-containing protein [Copromyces sp. CBS 386.78]|nr:PXA domain-containing protein [Copromyces sp. CBS 386.78]
MTTASTAAAAAAAASAPSAPSAPSASPAVTVTPQSQGGPAPTRLSTPRPKSPKASLEPSSSTNNLKASTRSSRTKRGSPSPQSNNHRTDPLSDKATVYLIRRILCPQHQDKGKTTPISIEDVLPPLTSRNDVDLQLYALIAIILREYVQNWYTKITPDDTFVAEIVQLIAHVTRALEQRLRNVDLESLLLDELPDLLDRHVTAYRAAHNPITQSPLQTDAREIYHALCPLPALSPVPRSGCPESIAEQAENEAAYRQLLVHAVLAVLLPTEDLQNNCLVALVGQILSELIIGNILANKLSEPWFIWECLSIASNVITRRRSVENEPLLRRKSKVPVQARRSSSIQSIQALFWTFIQWIFLAISFVRMAITILVTSHSLPPRLSRSTTAYENLAAHHTTQLDLEKHAGSSDVEPERFKTPVLAFRCWSAISNLIEMDGRMPWLSGTVSMLQWIMMRSPGRLGGVDGSIDRLLSYAVHKYILDPSGLPPLLRSARGALFPNNLPGTSSLTAPSSEDELLALRRKCAKDLWALISPGFMVKLVGSVYFRGRSGFGGNLSSSKARATGLEARPTATVSTGTNTNAPTVVSEEDAKRGVVAGAGAGASRSTTSRGASNAGPATVQPAAPQNSSQKKLQGGQTQMEQMRSGSGPKKSSLDQGQQAVAVPGSAAASTTGSGPVPTHQQGSVGSSGSLSSLSSVAPAPGFGGPGLGPGWSSRRGSATPSVTATATAAGIATTGSGSSSSSSTGNSRSSSKLSLTGGGSGSTNDATIRAAASATKTKLAKRVDDQHAHVAHAHRQQVQQELDAADANVDAGAGDDLAASASAAAAAAAGGQAHVDESEEPDEDEETILTEIEEGILDVFSDAYLNKHLIYSMLELVLVRLMPEFAEKRVSELWEERLA